MELDLWLLKCCTISSRRRLYLGLWEEQDDEMEWQLNKKNKKREWSKLQWGGIGKFIFHLL